MRINKHSIALLKGFIVIPQDASVDNRIAVSTVQANLMQWRYMLSEDAYTKLSKADLSEIVMFHNEAISFLKEVTGGTHSNKPLFEGFPQEVMSTNDVQLLHKQLLHYWTDGKWSPRGKEFEKMPAFENVKYNILTPIDEGGFDSIFTSLVSVNTSLTPQDMQTIQWFAQRGRKLVFPPAIPFKENLCTLAAMGLDVPVKTPTDVLRIAVHMSGGDISLPKVPKKLKAYKANKRAKVIYVKNDERKAFKFKKFKRAERRLILGLLEKTHCSPKEMVLKKERWLRLGEIIHPGEHASMFPKAAKAFDDLRNKKVRSWYGEVDAAFAKGFDKGLEKLGERGGEFMRRLDLLIRKNQNNKPALVAIFGAFRNAGKTSSNKVLFETLSHFEERTVPTTNRSIFVKGARKRTPLPNLAPLKQEVVDEVRQVVWEMVADKFSSLPSLGACWVDEELKKIPLPTNMRSLSEGLKPVIRGQRIPLENKDTKVVRLFVHWYNDGKRTAGCDIDLSAVLYKKGGTSPFLIGWNGSRSGREFAYSGDVTNKPGACAEYVDLDMNLIRKEGYTHAIMDIRDYKNGAGGISSYKDCVFGVMEREFPEENVTWFPQTITNCMKITSPSQGCIAGGFDLENREYFLIDADNKGATASSNLAAIWKAAQSCAEMPKFSVYDLVMMHVNKRGHLVTLDQNVDTYFKMEQFQNSYEKVAQLML